MKKRIFASALALVLLFGCASAEFYTANEDVYYHAKADCIAGSTFEISEVAAVQFEKLACPVCVDRKSVGGEMVVLPLPQEMNFNSYGCDIRDGRILVCGYRAEEERIVPFLRTFDMQGKELDSLKDSGAADMITQAAFLPDGRIAAVVIKDFLHINNCSLVLIEDMRITKTLATGAWFGFIHVAGDGFYVSGDPDGDGTRQLAKFDLQGNLLWQTEDFAPEALAKGLLGGEAGAVVYGYMDVAAGMVAVVDENGKFLPAPSSEAEAVARLAEDLPCLEGTALVNGEEITCEFANCILPWGEGYLTIMSVSGPYARIVQCNAEGKPVKDWFEEIGRIAAAVDLRLLRDGEDIYLYAYGITSQQLTGKDKWGVYGYPEKQTIVKKLEVEE